MIPTPSYTKSQWFVEKRIRTESLNFEKSHPPLEIHIAWIYTVIVCVSQIQAARFLFRKD